MGNRQSFAAGEGDRGGAGSVLVLTVPFALLLFQETRLEGYESEKAAFLAVLSLILIANWRGKPQQWRTWRLNPLVLSVLLYLVVLTLSTIFSLSPSTSLWGGPQRSQGLISVLAYVVVFFQCVRSGDALRQRLTPILVCAAVPVCVFSIIERVAFGIARPGSTAGQPNYLSSGLILILLFLMHDAASWHISHRTARRARLVFFALVIGLIGTALVLASSRGALAGLFLGIIVSILTFGAVWRRRSYVVGAVALFAGAIVVYGLVWSSLGQAQTDVRRIFQPTDEFRTINWQIASDLIRRQSEPLIGFDGRDDQLAGLRLVLGYGLESLPQLQTRFGVPFGEAYYFDGTHNVIFDTLLTSGLMGLIAISAVFLSAAAWTLFRLGILSRRSFYLWSLLELVCIVAGAQIIQRVSLAGSTSGLAPLGAALGAVAGLAIWLIGMAFTKTRYGIEIERRHIYLVGLLSIVVAHWVDLQFGFAQHASDGLWWLFLGLIAQRGLPGSQEEAVEAQARSWQLGMGISGIFVIYSFGSSIQSSFIQHEIASAYLPFLLGVILVVGIVGYTLTAKPDWGLFLSIVVLWGVWAGAKNLISSLSASLLDRALVTGNVAPLTLLQSLFLLSLKGCYAYVLGILWCIRSFRLAPYRFRIVLTLLLGSLGLVYYSVHNVSSTLHAVGDAFTGTRQVEGLRIAESAYELSAFLTPDNDRLRMAWATVLLTHLRTQLDRGDYPELIHAQLLALFQAHPYYNNTLSWGLFLRSYYDLFSAQPPLLGSTTSSG